MPAVINPCEFVACRNVELGEESLRRHYDMLLEIAKDYFEVITKSYVGELHKWRSITELYDDVRISSKIGDKILDRLECCWRYIVCRRGVGNRRKYCAPTLLGLIAIFSKPEYYSKLKEHLLTHYCKDSSDGECRRILDEFTLYGEKYSSILSLFKSIDNLRALIDKVRTTILNDEAFRSAVNEYFASFLNDEETRKRLIARLHLPGTASTGAVMDKLLKFLMSDEVTRAELDIVIFGFLMRFLPILTETQLKLLLET